MARMLIYTSYGAEEPERAMLAWETGVNALAAGHETVLFLAAEAVRFAGAGYAATFDEGEREDGQPAVQTMTQLVDRYLADGGTLVACATSATTRSVTPERILPGAEIATTERLVASLAEGFIPIYM